MARYFASGEQTLIADLAAADSALTVTSNASTPNRGWVYEVNFANYGSPADLTACTWSDVSLALAQELPGLRPS